ncbi:T9SS type A sorting domain-containing protein [Marinilabilia sp.]|uniref:T9SS type A sorting domain-containing protein n=1 Tax=Marinilabilia sp. TaxID=2021252 RepID=UPI0025BB684B|nr:T9SS type A sorting domain-containing protein [Marinilabilia sp.]
MKQSFLLFFLLFLPAITYAQSVTYAYDSSGKRVNRTLIISKSTTGSNTDSTKIGQSNPAFDSRDNYEIKIFPNPTYGSINISVNNIGAVEGMIQLCDNKGILLGQYEFLKDISINLNHFSSGLYLLKIKIGSQQTIWKILKK